MKTLIKNALYQGKQVDVLISDGLFTKIEKTDAIKPEGLDVVDVTGYVLLPALVDCHTHIDKTMWGMEWYVNAVGPLRIDRINNERVTRYKIGHDPALQASRHIELSLGLGVLHMRSHVDIDTENGLRGVEGVLKARETYKDLLHVELVAFPQSGLLSRPGTYELMDEALSMGIDVVGGIDPASIDRDPAGSIDAIFRLAQKHSKPIDIHLHDFNELGGFSIELIVERTVALGMQGKVAISHALCLGSSNAAMVSSLVEMLAKANIHIITGGQASIPSVPSVKQLVQAGVNICGGNDDVRDMWSPYGTGDMIERVQFIAMRNAFRRDDDLELALSLCTDRGAALLGLNDYGIKIGHQANFVLGKARNVVECIVSCPSDRVVFRKGEIIARNSKILTSRLQD